MKVDFKSSPATLRAAQIIGVIYMVYGVFMLGFPGLLLSLAIGLIVMGINGSFELSVAITIIVGILYRILYKQFDGYQTYNPKEVIDRLAQMKAAGKMTSPPVGWDGRMYQGDKPHPDGVLASDFAEGFANPEADKADATGTSASGSESSKTAASSAPAPATGSDANKKDSTTTTSGFQGSSDGLFKLGEIPTEMMGGPHIDAGSTILSAIQNLKPDQLKSMTDDTRKLLDTQKSLLGMLETMKPMIADGSQLLSSFNTMFGKTAQ